MDEQFRPVSGRRRVFILLLAVATAVTVLLTLLAPPGGARVKRQTPLTPDMAVCADGKTSGCVGGKADVIALPRAPPASVAGTQRP